LYNDIIKYELCERVVGNVIDILRTIRGVYLVICNSIFSAHTVIECALKQHKVFWVLHEKLTDQMINESGICEEVIENAVNRAHHIVYFNRNQIHHIKPNINEEITIPATKIQSMHVTGFSFIVALCPNDFVISETNKVFRHLDSAYTKMQLVIVNMSQRGIAASSPPDMKDDITRIRHLIIPLLENFIERGDTTILIPYPIAYNDLARHIVMIAMSMSIPIVAINSEPIAELITTGVEGFLCQEGDTQAVVESLTQLHPLRFTLDSERLHHVMGQNASSRYQSQFKLPLLIDSTASPYVILVDMDGALVDWDRGFMSAWKNKSKIFRNKSYNMEDCVPPEYRTAAIDLFHSKGFFETLPPMKDGIRALEDMTRSGLQVYICTTPVFSSAFCAQEKISWIRTHFGEKWTNRIIFAGDKVSEGN
jgi:hypothetical protein